MTFIAIDIMIRKARQRYRHKLMDQRIALAGPSLMSPDPNFIFWRNPKFYPSTPEEFDGKIPVVLISLAHEKPKRLFYLAKCLAMLCYLTDCVETITRLDVKFFFPTGLRLSRLCTSARGGKVYRESTLRPHGRSKYANFLQLSTQPFPKI